MTSHDLAFQDWVARAKDVRVIDVLSQRGIRLRGGTNKAGPCPSCGGRDRFSVNTRRDWFYCRGCQKGGDAIELVRLVDACDFLTACEILTGEPAPRGQGAGVDRDELERRKQVREQAKHEARRRYEAAERRALDAAAGLWNAGVPVKEGDPVDLYLRGRRLVLPAGADIRLHPSCSYSFEVSDNERITLGHYPTMMVAARFGGETFKGVHLTYLEQGENGGWRKVRLEHPSSGALPAKKIRGRFWHSLAFLGGNRSASTLVVGEGVETTLSVYRVCPPSRQERWMWAAGLSLHNLAALKLPHDVRQVVLLKDGDSDPAVANAVMASAIDAYTTSGRAVRVVEPTPGMDFNDMLMEGAHG